MHPPVFQARLRPVVPEGLRLPRERLLARVRACPQARVVVVEGPGGCGKTSLLVDLAALRAEPIAWYTVDEVDPRAFLCHLVEAVSQVCPEGAARARQVCAIGEAVGLEVALSTLLNDLMEARLTLVLDDAHRAPDLELLRTLVTSAPPGLSLLLGTRERPPFPLSRLEAQRRAVHLRPRELHLEPDEVEALLQLWGRDPTAAEAWHRATGGWLAALVLLRETKLPTPALPSEPEALFDYLTEEVLRGLPADKVELMLCTSVLDELDPESAAAVSGQTEPRSILSRLERAGMLLVPLDGSGLRYHDLLLAFLRREAGRRLGETGVRELHRRAGIHLRSRRPDRAIHHFVQAGDGAAAAELLAACGPELVQRGWVEQTSQWLDLLPPSVQESFPHLRLLRGALAEAKGDWPAAVDWYQEGARLLGEQNDGPGLARGLQLAAVCLARYGERDAMLPFIEEAHRLCPQEDPALRARVVVWLGGIKVYVGADMPEGYRLAREGYHLARRTEDLEALAGAYICHAFMSQLAQGKFAASLRLLEEGVELMKRADSSYMAFHLLVDITLVHLVAYQLVPAGRALARAEEAARDFPNTWVGVGHRLNQATLALLQGDLENGLRHIAELENLPIPLNIRAWFGRVAVQLYLRSGRRRQARKATAVMLEVVRLQGADGYYAPECYLAQAEVLAAEGDLAGAAAAASCSLRVSLGGQMRFWEMKSRAALAWLNLQSGRPDEAREALAGALALSRRGRYGAFWLHDPWGARLLDLGWEVEGDYVRSLRARLMPPRLHALPEAQASVRVFTLGGFRVLSGDRPLEARAWGRRKVLQLFKLLLAQPTLTLSVDRAIDTLWPDTEADQARHYLSVHVSAVRRALGPVGARLVHVGNAYRLELGPDLSVDWVELQEAIKACETALREGSEDEALRWCAEAERLYAGEFLPEEPGDHRVEEMRRQLRRSFASLLACLADRFRAQGRVAEAGRWAVKATEVNAEN